MAKSTGLFDLIHTLTKSEKRYFRLFSSLQEGKKNYDRLFDFLEKMDVYNEEKILEHFQGEPFTKQLHSVKNYLYNLIMKSLRNYHSERSVDIRLANLMTDADLLNRRGLYDLRDGTLRRARKLAEKYERNYYLLEILKRMVSYAVERRTKKMKEELELLCENILNISIALLKESELYILNYRFAVFFRQQKSKKLKLEQLLLNYENNNILKYDVEKLSFDGKIFYYNVAKYVCRFSNNHQGTFANSRELINIWKDNPHQIIERPMLYKLYLGNLMNDANRIRRYDDFQEHLEEIRCLPSRDFSEEAETFQNYAFMELLYFLNTEKIYEGEERLPHLVEGLEKYQAKINKARWISFCYNISILYLLLRNFDAALVWGNRILQDATNEHRRDLHRSMLLLQLIYHYELHNFNLLESLLTSVPKRLKRKGKLNHFERIILDTFLMVLQSSTKKEASQFLIDLKIDLQALKKSHKNNTFLGFDEFLAWLEIKR